MTKYLGWSERLIYVVCYIFTNLKDTFTPFSLASPMHAYSVQLHWIFSTYNAYPQNKQNYWYNILYYIGYTEVISSWSYFIFKITETLLFQMGGKFDTISRKKFEAVFEDDYPVILQSGSWTDS